MDFFENRNYRLNRSLLSCFGQWPLQSPKERYFFRTTAVLIVGSIIVPKIIKFMETIGDMNGMLECLPVLSLHFRSVSKFINCTANAKKMKMLTIQIKKSWTMRTADFENDVLRRYASRGRVLTILYAVYISSALLMFLSVPLIPLILDIIVPLNESRERIYPYETEYFLEENEKYFYVLAHAWFTMPFSLGMIVAHDTMFAVNVHHACSIFAMLGARLENIGVTGSNEKQLTTGDSREDNRDKTYEDIVTCIKIHKEAVDTYQYVDGKMIKNHLFVDTSQWSSPLIAFCRFVVALQQFQFDVRENLDYHCFCDILTPQRIAKLLESSGCACWLVVVGVSMMATTLTGFMTVINLDQPVEAMRFAAFAIGEVIHLFYVCWQGHLLVEHSEHIFINAYNVDWYDISPRAKKLLILIMIRSSKPCQLTAGKIYILSMENFAAALKTSMSYFTVLLSMQ